MQYMNTNIFKCILNSALIKNSSIVMLNYIHIHGHQKEKRLCQGLNELLSQRKMFNELGLYPFLVSVFKWSLAVSVLMCTNAYECE